MDWRNRASCSGMTELFYSDAHRRCRTICERCPVQEQCLTESIELEEITQPFFGVRGGMIPSERIRWRMRRRDLNLE